MDRPNRWTVAWLFLGLFALGMEIAALLIDGARDSLSAQVWMIIGWSPAIYVAALVGFGAGAAWMAVHFFGRRE